jgi:hypothetical protein
MAAILDWILNFFGPSRGDLDPDFVRTARTFYPSPEDVWIPVDLQDGKTHYVLDAKKLEVSERLLYVSRKCDALWSNLNRTQSPGRAKEMARLAKCLAPKNNISHVVQKPLGGYDVRAYAQGSWIFLESPTFSYIETGEDGINTTESKRRATLFDITLHELAHVAGHWTHDSNHEACIAWLRDNMA